MNSNRCLLVSCEDEKAEVDADLADVQDVVEDVHNFSSMRSLLDSSTTENLQRLIEKAEKIGYDAVGAIIILVV